jgi:hypothetical protein
VTTQFQLIFFLNKCGPHLRVFRQLARSKCHSPQQVCSCTTHSDQHSSCKKSILWSAKFIGCNFTLSTPRTHAGGVQIQVLLLLNLGNGWMWVVNSTPRPIYPQGNELRNPQNMAVGRHYSWSGDAEEEKKSLARSGIRTLGPIPITILQLRLDRSYSGEAEPIFVLSSD